MPYPELTIGPMDPDASSELTSKLGTHNQVDKLIQRNAALYPIALTKALSKGVDGERSEALDTDEVRDYLLDLRGRKAFFSDDDELVEASVRVGRGDPERVVAILFRVPSGRTARAIIPYADLPRSQAAYAAAQEEKEAEKAGGSRSAPAQYEGGPDPESDRALADAQAKADAAETARLQAEQARVSMEQRLSELEEKLQDQAEPEPYDGYDDENAEAVIARVKGGGLTEFGTVGLQRLHDYEASHKKRSSVLHAAEDAISSAA